MAWLGSCGPEWGGHSAFSTQKGDRNQSSTIPEQHYSERHPLQFAVIQPQQDLTQETHEAE